MVAYRWLVAALVAVVTLVGGAFRTTVIDELRAQIVFERGSDDTEQGTLDRGRSVVQARATKPTRVRAGDGLSPASNVEPYSRSFDLARAEFVREPSTVDVLPRRVRPHVEHMVFLI